MTAMVTGNFGGPKTIPATASVGKNSASHEQRLRACCGRRHPRQQINSRGPSTELASGQEAEQHQRPGICRANPALVILPASAAGMLAINKLAVKMALEVMIKHVVVFAFAQTLTYAMIYSCIFLVRCWQRIIDVEMMKFARQKFLSFVGIGFIETLFLLTNLIASANLPGAALPVLSQFVLVWNFLLSAFILGRRFEAVQLLGAALVSAGAVTVAGGGFEATCSNIKYSIMMMMCMLLPALSSVMKEKIFVDGRKALKDRQLDVFVVNASGSLAQAVFTTLCLPVIAQTKGITMETLPGYFHQGILLLTGHSSHGWAAAAPALAIAVNIVFNILGLVSIRAVGAATLSIFMTASLPFSVYLFTLDVPVIGPSPPLQGAFLVGSAILMAGLFCYNFPLMRGAQPRAKET